MKIKKLLNTSLGQMLSVSFVPWLSFAVLLSIDRILAYDLDGFRMMRCVYIFGVELFWSMAFVAPYALLGKCARRIYLPLAILLLLSDGLQGYCRLNHDIGLDGDWLGIFLSSSWSEILTFLKCAVSWPLVLGLAGMILVVVALAKSFRWITLPSKRQGAILAIVMFLVGASVPVFVYPTVKDGFGRLVNYHLCTNFIWDTISQYGPTLAFQELATQPQIGGNPKCSVDKNAIGVIVLGESATRNRWSLYGYNRSTTPRMDAISDELVVFSNLVSTAFYTFEAMRLLFTEASLDSPADMRCTLAQVLSAAGYDCKLFSSQARWGQSDAFESSIFAGCSEQIYLTEKFIGKEWYDDALLDFVDAELAKPSDRPRILFLHLKGSHFPPSINYPQTFAPFPREEVNGTNWCNPLLSSGNYDNSIAFTDQLLGNLVDRLKRQAGKTWLFYVSDHGESVDVAETRMSFRMRTNRNVWEIPMIFWTSESYRAAHADFMKQAYSYADAPLQSDLLFATLLRIGDVEGYESARPETSFDTAPFGYRKVRHTYRNALYERQQK